MSHCNGQDRFGSDLIGSYSKHGAGFFAMDDVVSSEVALSVSGSPFLFAVQTELEYFLVVW